MRSGGNMILGFSQYRKSVKLPFIIYANYESLIVNVDWCRNNSEKLSITNIAEHIPLDFSIFSTL